MRVRIIKDDLETGPTCISDTRGATSIEYSLIIALIFLAIVVGVNAFADASEDMYDEIGSAMTSV
ncbi:MAG: Flp family type IVb pilin [Pseudomonadota bacterium]